jgi:peroxiredoxin
MAGTQAWDEQFLRGTDEWCARIELGAGMDQNAHNGMVVLDIDEDGLEDIYICQPGGLPNRLLRQKADGTVEDVAGRYGLDWLDNTRSALWLDLDGMGSREMVVSTSEGILLCSQMDGERYEIQTVLASSGGYSISAVDIDGDSLLDLFVCQSASAEENTGLPLPYHDANNGPANYMLRNSGGLKFEDVTQEVGLGKHNNRFSFAASWADYDEDGDQDLYVANDYGRNCLYRNDYGQFTDVAAEAGVEDIPSGMGVSWGDYDGDGHVDLYVSNMFSSTGPRVAYPRNSPRNSPGNPSDATRAINHRDARGNSLFRNRGDGIFEDVALASDLWMGRWSWGAGFVDFDNDGQRDLFIPNGFITNEGTEDLWSFFWRQVSSKSALNGSLAPDNFESLSAVIDLVRRGDSWGGRERNSSLMNLGDGSFMDVSSTMGLDFVDDARNFVSVDWDGDGDLDLWVKNRSAPLVRFLRNDGAEGGFVRFMLEGEAPNRDGVGARVEVRAGAQVMIAERRIGTGFLTQGSPWLHFGLGQVESVDSVNVTWPGGEQESFDGIQAGQSFILRHGNGTAQSIPSSLRELELLPSLVVAPAPRKESRVVLTQHVPLPSLQFTRFNGKQRSLGQAVAKGPPTLLTFWASEHPNCAQILRDWSASTADFRKAGATLLALSLDEDPGTAKALWSSLKLPFEGGMAPKKLSALFDLLQQMPVDHRRPMEVPTSFLLNGHGEIAVIYRGLVGPETIVTDIARLNEPIPAYAGAAFPGRAFGRASGLDLLDLADRLMHRDLVPYALFYLKELEPARKDSGK